MLSSRYTCPVHLSVTPARYTCPLHLSVTPVLLCVSWQAEEERVNHAKRLEQEERIAKELSRIKYEREREEKMRQYIRENRYSVGYHALIGVTLQIMLWFSYYNSFTPLH